MGVSGMRRRRIRRNYSICRLVEACSLDNKINKNVSKLSDGAKDEMGFKESVYMKETNCMHAVDGSCVSCHYMEYK